MAWGAGQASPSAVEQPSPGSASGPGIGSSSPQPSVLPQLPSSAGAQPVMVANARHRTIIMLNERIEILLKKRVPLPGRFAPHGYRHDRRFSRFCQEEDLAEAGDSSYSRSVMTTDEIRAK